MCELSLSKLLAARKLLRENGWHSLGCWKFMAPGDHPQDIYDLEKLSDGELDLVVERGAFPS